MAYCRFCGALLAEGARFCHLCGKEIATAHHCPQCGALLPEESRFCSACGAAVAGAAPAASGTPQHHQGRPPEIPLGRGRTITLPAPQVAPAPPPSPVPPPDSAPLAGVCVPAVQNTGDFTGSVQRFFGADGSCYTFQGAGMYGFLEPFSMNYTGGQGPIVKNGGTWFYRAGGQSVEVPALQGAQILTSAPEGMYVYIAPIRTGCLSPIWGLLRKSRRPTAAPCAATVLM